MDNSITGAEIFESGRWNNLDFTDADLDGIVSAFAALNLSGRVPIKYGHTGPDHRDGDGAPALGWVSRVYRRGSKLLADITDVAPEVMARIKSGAYKFVSVELLRNVQAASRKIPWVLDAVALLGATAPAVGTLSPLHASRAPLDFETQVSFTRQETDDDMETKEQFAALTKKHKDMLFEIAVRAGLPPREREQFNRRNPDATVEEVEVFIRDAPKPAKGPAVVTRGGSTVIEHGGRADFRALDAVNKLILERRQAGDPLPGQSFEVLLAAAKAVFRADPELAKAWQEAPGER